MIKSKLSGKPGLVQGLTDLFGEASTQTDCGLEELVKLIARISAEKDYNEVLDSSNPEYTAGKKKGRTL